MSKVKYLHHGAAASSHRGSLAWIPASSAATDNNDPSTANSETRSAPNSCWLVYASHSVLNIAEPGRVRLTNGTEEPVWHVRETLCTETVGKGDDSPEHVITCLQSIFDSSSIFSAAIVAGFADGTITIWIRDEKEKEDQEAWTELCVTAQDQQPSTISITCIDALWVDSQSTLLVVVGTFAGSRLYECHILEHEGYSFSMTVSRNFPLLEDTAVCSLSFRYIPDNEQILALIGTAAPRHNKIHVLHASAKTQEVFHFHYSGSLMGHEDWITCMAWSCQSGAFNRVNGGKSMTITSALLATGSQDTRIRLWKFTTSATPADSTVGMIGSQEEQEPALVPNQGDEEGDFSDGDDGIIHEEEEEQEGESRLDIHHNKTTTRVTLEALLMSHEEGVTSLCWYRHAAPVYNQEHLLLSSSMDRSIFLWTPGTDGIWTPLTRVGSAGGILGGSIGSTLLGYLAATFEPLQGTTLVGHAYGGALHVWNLDGMDTTDPDKQQPQTATTEELASRLYWRAKPCITGHFSGVTDLCWESSAGHYLLTVSADQTCRLWGPAESSFKGKPIWLELSRPQVHGYNMAAVTSLSSPQNPHFLVTGGDEKELRAFDAPLATIRTIQAVTGMPGIVPGSNSDEDPIKRVERAYIPSLGLSNKATSAEGAEEDAPEHATARTNLVRLPLERDLGAASLWPEVQKLFGHTTKLYCVTSTLESRSGLPTTAASKDDHDVVLVASSCKARDEAAATIRLWRAREGICQQVLTGGHKATVASMAFSGEGKYLASSGKDRRLCLWQRQQDGRFHLAWAKDSAHKRIVWSVHFLPWGNGRILTSGSRDGCVKIWSIIEYSSPSFSLEVKLVHSFAPCYKVNGKPDAVTALSFCPRAAPATAGGQAAILAVGLESGRIELWKVPLAEETDNESPSVWYIFPANLCHKATVTKLAWRPTSCSSVAKGTNDDVGGLILASCSMDHSCRIFEVQI